jgi:hypothetical protein
MTDIKALVERVGKLLPVSWDNEVNGFGEPTHAVLTFGTHQTQAITMAPDDFMALNELAQAISTLLSDNERLRDLLQEVTVKGIEDLCECGQPECLTFRIRESLSASPLEGRE